MPAMLLLQGLPRWSAARCRLSMGRVGHRFSDELTGDSSLGYVRFTVTVCRQGGLLCNRTVLQVELHREDSFGISTYFEIHFSLSSGQGIRNGNDLLSSPP